MAALVCYQRYKEGMRGMNDDIIELHSQESHLWGIAHCKDVYYYSAAEFLQKGRFKVLSLLSYTMSPLMKSFLCLIERKSRTIKTLSLIPHHTNVTSPCFFHG